MSISTIKRHGGAPPVLEISTVLIGSLNDMPVHLTGSGTIDETEGHTDAIFEVKKLPDEVDPRALGPFLFTGYPNSCRTEGSVRNNPFSGGSYSYSRQYDFTHSSKVASLNVFCDLDIARGKLESVFEIHGELPMLGAVGGVSPIYELWSPTENNIQGLFNVAWLDEVGHLTLETATATSSYNAVRKEALGGKNKYRFLELTSELISTSAFHVAQNSTLVRG